MSLLIERFNFPTKLIGLLKFQFKYFYGRGAKSYRLKPPPFKMYADGNKGCINCVSLFVAEGEVI